MKAWGIDCGPVNRHGQLRPRRLTAQSVALVVKRYAEKLGKDASTYAGSDSVSPREFFSRVSISCALRNVMVLPPK